VNDRTRSRMNTRPIVAALAAALAAGTAAAQTPMTLKDLEAKAARRLERDELLQLMTGAKITRAGRDNSFLRWTQESDGSFLVSSDSRTAGRGIVQAKGTWRVDDAGQWCVVIQWNTIPEDNWCNPVYTTSDGYYAALRDAPTAQVRKYEITK
jgi:hypothetical protein